MILHYNQLQLQTHSLHYCTVYVKGSKSPRETLQTFSVSVKKSLVVGQCLTPTQECTAESEVEEGGMDVEEEWEEVFTP